MKFVWSINGEYVTEKNFKDAYGEEIVKEIKKELKESGPYTTMFLCDGLDEVSIY